MGFTPVQNEVNSSLAVWVIWKGRGKTSIFG